MEQKNGFLLLANGSTRVKEYFSRQRKVRRSKKWFFIAGEWFDEGKRAFF